MNFGSTAFGQVSFGGNRETTLPTLTLSIGDSRQEEFLLEQSFRITKELNSRSLLDFTIVDSTLAKTFLPGTRVYAASRGNILFSGIADSVSSKIPDGEKTKFISFTCTDNNAIADRFLVSAVFENQTVLQIVTSVVTVLTPMAQEGVQIGTVDESPLIQKASFHYDTVTNLFRDLAELTGMVWEIDAYKKLNFRSTVSYLAHFAIGDASSVGYRDMAYRTSKSASKYRNKQIFVAGKALTQEQIRKFAGDGKTRTFSLDFEVAKLVSPPPDANTPTPSITRNGVPQKVGIRGVDVEGEEGTAQWYYAVDEKEISQNDDEVGHAALTAAEELRVNYFGQFPIVLISRNTAEIAARKAFEGGTGIYEKLEEDETANGRELATKKAEALLRIYGRIPNRLEFEIDQAGLTPGMLFSAVRSNMNISAEFLVESLDITLRSPLNSGLPVYKIEALDGESQGGWTAFYREQQAAGRKFAIRENEVISTAEVLEETLHLTDSVPVVQTRSSAPFDFYVVDKYTDEYTQALIAPNSSTSADDPATFIIGCSSLIPGKTSHRGSKIAK